MKPNKNMKPRSEQISDIVNSVKSGKLESKKLFSEIARLDSTKDSLKFENSSKIFHFEVSLSNVPKKGSVVHPAESKYLLKKERRKSYLHSYLKQNEMVKKVEDEEITVPPTSQSPNVKNTKNKPQIFRSRLITKSRLFEDVNRRKSRTLLYLQANRLREMKDQEKQCTFRPRLHKTSVKYNQANVIKITARQKSVPELKEKKDDELHTFVPMTTELQDKTSRLKCYLRSNVSLRLSQKNSCLSKSKAFTEEKQKSEPVMNERKINAFLKRQQHKKYVLKSKKDEIFNERKSCLKKSKAMATKKHFRRSERMNRFTKLQLGNENRKQSCKESAMSQAPQKWKLRMQRIEEMREEVYRKNHSFVPKRTKVGAKYSAISSRHINQKTSQKLLMLKQCQQLKSQIECTFSPNLSAPPKYLYNLRNC